MFFVPVDEEERQGSHDSLCDHYRRIICPYYARVISNLNKNHFFQGIQICFQNFLKYCFDIWVMLVLVGLENKSVLNILDSEEILFTLF